MRAGTGIASLIAFAFALVGCGGSDVTQSEGVGPRAVAVEWTKAMASHDGAKACSLMTPASVHSIEKPLKPLPNPPVGGGSGKYLYPGRPSGPCGPRMSHGLAPKLPIASTSVRGGKAVVRMEDRSQLLHRVVLWSMHGRWLVDFDRTWDHPFGTD